MQKATRLSLKPSPSSPLRNKLGETSYTLKCVRIAIGKKVLLEDCELRVSWWNGNVECTLQGDKARHVFEWTSEELTFFKYFVGNDLEEEEASTMPFIAFRMQATAKNGLDKFTNGYVADNSKWDEDNEKNQK